VAATEDRGIDYHRGSTRIVVAVLLIAAGIGIFQFSSGLRFTELTITGWVLRLIASQTVVNHADHIVFFERGSRPVFGLQMAASCSAVFLVAPFFFLGAIMTLLPRVHVRRLATGVAIAGGAVFFFNQFRLLVIAWATERWGVGAGFDWAHILAGGIVTTLAVLLALYLFFRLSLAGNRWSQSSEALTPPA
jgi:exosortase/archaeosortase family protein